MLSELASTVSPCVGRGGERRPWRELAQLLKARARRPAPALTVILQCAEGEFQQPARRRDVVEVPSSELGAVRCWRLQRCRAAGRKQRCGVALWAPAVTLGLTGAEVTWRRIAGLPTEAENRVTRPASESVPDLGVVVLWCVGTRRDRPYACLPARSAQVGLAEKAHGWPTGNCRRKHGSRTVRDACQFFTDGWPRTDLVSAFD